jgi:hypothetical protein
MRKTLSLALGDAGRFEETGERNPRSFLHATAKTVELDYTPPPSLLMMFSTLFFHVL